MTRRFQCDLSHLYTILHCGICIIRRVALGLYCSNICIISKWPHNFIPIGTTLLLQCMLLINRYDSLKVYFGSGVV
jgi:hypothetical protein